MTYVPSIFVILYIFVTVKFHVTSTHKPKEKKEKRKRFYILLSFYILIYLQSIWCVECICTHARTPTHKNVIINIYFFFLMKSCEHKINIDKFKQAIENINVMNKPNNWCENSNCEFDTAHIRFIIVLSSV